MDNVTHSLIGLAVGEAVATYTKKARVPIWIASAIANNLPDLDVAATSTFFRDRTGYLLHHRGHSHTLLVAPIFSLLLLLGLWCWWRKREIPWTQIILVAFLGVPTHLFADYWNSYGVHPFWPWNNNWFYGDMIFIVEPWIWMLLIPPLFLRTQSRTGRGLLLALGALILGLTWLLPLVSVAAAAAFTAVGLAWAAWQWWLRSPGIRISAALASLGALLIGMHFTSNYAKSLVPDAQGAEIAATPFPENPFRWSVVSARLTATEYIARAEEISLLTGRQELASKEFRAPRAELSALSKDCRIHAFLRFVRVPFWKRTANGWLVGDLRFDSRAKNFAQIVFPDQKPGAETCPRLVPPWQGRFLDTANR